MCQKLRSLEAMVAYDSLDMKRCVDHAAIAKHYGLLHNLLAAVPSGLVNQKSLQAAWESVLQKLGLETKHAEVDTYKTRVMLAHLRLIATRNLPKHLPEDVVKKVKTLLGLLDFQAKAENTKRMADDSQESQAMSNRAFP